MDEQRMLAEIERRLSAEDPRLATRLSSFRRPGPTATLRTSRGKLIGSLFAIALVAVVSMMVYAMVPFRAHGPKTTSSPQASTSAPARYAPTGASANSSASTGGNTSGSSARAAASAGTARTSASATAAKDNTATKTTTGSHAPAARTTGTKTTNLAPATAG
jgi:cytoskeletal protein RodZ